MPMNTSQTRVVDRVISKILLGVKVGKLVGEALFPYVDITRLDNKIIKFDKDDFRLYFARRSPGSTISSFEVSYSDETIALHQDSMAAKVPIERLEESTEKPGVNLRQMASKRVMINLLRTLEYDQAQLATNTVNYNASNTVTLSGTDQFDDAGSDPIGVIENGRDVIRSKIGTYPNTAIISAQAFNSLKTHVNIVDRFKHTSGRSVTKEMIAELFELERLEIGTEVYLNESDGSTEDMWNKDIVLAYVPQDSMAGEEEPSYGYTFRLAGTPLAREPRFDETDECWKQNVKFERRAYILGKDAGYLIKNAVS